MSNKLFQPLLHDFIFTGARSLATVLLVRFKQTFTRTTAEAHPTVAMSKANGYGVHNIVEEKGKERIGWLVGGPLKKKNNAQGKGSGHMTRR